MTIETVEDLCNDIADKLGVYGACKSEDINECKSECAECCRVGFMLVWPDRIRKAVDNENKINQSGL